MKASLNLTLNEMLDAGMHFGHKKERSHARAKSFIYCVREGISIIDLEKTQESLETAKNAFNNFINEGKTILFVSTKTATKDMVRQVAESLEMPFVTEKWLGGTLTNFETIQQSLKRLTELETLRDTEEFKQFTKKERLVTQNRIERMQKVLSGISKMNRLPDVLFIVDIVREKNAVDEAIKIDLPIIAICDTNANPQRVDYPIFANDDAPTSVKKALTVVTGIDFSQKAESKEKAAATLEDAAEA